ncbi:MAG: putative cytochrome hydroxylase [Acidobacteria bacterium]|nr:putative cytochrome hydroxylase [Acidobacteriota bacterium]
MSDTRFLRVLSAVLRRVRPIAKFGNTTLVTRYADVVEALQRDDFLVAPIYGVKLDAAYISSLLGSDRDDRYEREAAMLRTVARREDLVRIRQLGNTRATAAIGRVAATGRIDVAGEFSRTIALDLAADYFGLRGPDDRSMARWTRDIFYDVFLNDANEPAAHAVALESARELRDYATTELARRKSENESTNDLLGRMLGLQSQPEYAWLDDDAIRRSVSNLVVASIDTTSMFLTFALDVLLRRPNQLRRAQAAAASDDLDAVGRFIWEAARFKQPTPYLFRAVGGETRLGGTTIGAGSRVMLLLASAMFDPAVLYKPSEFRADRDTPYLHFGAGAHQCFGAQISRALLPELAAALLRLPNLRRASSIAYDGPFPDRFVVTFDPPTS